MKKILFIVLTVGAIEFLSSCGINMATIANHNANKTQVQLSSNNFNLIDRINGSAEIGYDRLKELTGYLRVIFQSKMERTEYANALAHMIYTLYQLKGQATPDQLFASADLTEVSGYRYASFFKKAKMIRYSPTNKKGYYVLTYTGKAFVEGKITTDEEFCKAIEIEKDLMYRFRR